MICTSHEASSGKCSARSIASEYGSCPVDDAAHQMRSCVQVRRAWIRPGNMCLRKASNGALSRKKVVSFVVIASTT
jgi:hypothetical protein